MPADPPDHVVILFEENQSCETVIGHPELPFINSLAQQGTLFTQSYAITHPSQPNYLAFFGVTDNLPIVLDESNLATQLLSHGYTFTGWHEADSTPNEMPWLHFEDTTHLGRLMVYFPTDFNQLPTVSMVIHNNQNNMHDDLLAQSDQLARDHLSNYVEWAKTNDSSFILTFDEDNRDQNNHITTIVVGEDVPAGAVNDTRMTLVDFLHSIERLYGLPLLGDTTTDAHIDLANPAAAVTTTAAAAQADMLV